MVFKTAGDVCLYILYSYFELYEIGLYAMFLNYVTKEGKSLKVYEALNLYLDVSLYKQTSL